MATATATAEASSQGRCPGGRWRGRAFGLELDLPCPPAAPLASVGGRSAPRTVVELVDDDDLTSSWPERRATHVGGLESDSGETVMRIEQAEGAGYRLHAPRFGSYVISPAGDLVRCVPQGEDWHWQRFLFAQVLPLASALRGFEVFHASAVGLENHALAFVGGSGAGKTSLSTQLLLRGASLLADDVLALRPVHDRVEAQPGPCTANLGIADHAALPAVDRERLGRVLGIDGKVHLAIRRTQQRPLWLRAVYYLERTGGDASLRISHMWPPDPRYLLGSTFVRHLRTPEHLVSQLEVAARLSRNAAVYHVFIPEGTDPATLAEVVADHARELVAA